MMEIILHLLTDCGREEGNARTWLSFFFAFFSSEPTWQVLQPIFVSFLFGEGSYLAPNLEELERMNGE